MVTLVLEIPAEGVAEPGPTEAEEKKKRRGRKKSKLEDMFPAYLQVKYLVSSLRDISPWLHFSGNSGCNTEQLILSV